MESGQGSLTGLQAMLSAIDGQVLIRAAVQAGRHAVWYIDAIVAPPAEPAGWQPLVWEYEVRPGASGTTWPVGKGATTSRHLRRFRKS